MPEPLPMPFLVIRDGNFHACSSAHQAGLLTNAARRHNTVHSSLDMRELAHTSPAGQKGNSAMPELSPLPKCDDPGCQGHLGKFSDCRAEAVYGWSLDGFADESTGTGDFEGHYALFIVPEPQNARVDPEQDRMVTVPAGHYILHESGTGSVSLWTYETEAEARAEFDAALDRYSAYEDGDDA